MRRLVCDLDGTLCTTRGMDYANATPRLDRIARVRQHYDAGEHIVIDTGRAAAWKPLTITQCVTWDIPYHELRVGIKAPADLYVDDRAINADEFFGDATQGDWPDEYFAHRVGNDPRRQQAFEDERRFLYDLPNHVTGAVCDVGCSTGELLEALRWRGPRYGMEINPHARCIAEESGIDFTKNILTERDFFDVVVFRGTLQHLPEPFRYLRKAHDALKSGGHLCVLATPNTDSWCYRLLGNFPPPLNDAPRNYWMPSSRQLQNALKNIGFEIAAVEYPYWDGPYARPLYDALSFLLAAFGRWRSFSWPGNMMNVIARRP